MPNEKTVSGFRENWMSGVPDIEIKHAECQCDQCRPGSAKPAPETDNWIHRSAGMRCHTCMYYVPKLDNPNDLVVKGRCRRHAPTISGWPVMFPTDWCGDHKLS